MSFCSWPALDWKVSGDGLLTFFGGLLAFFAILLQVWRADKGLQNQLNVEKLARADAAKDQRRAVATAILFEIDHHYKSDIRDVLALFERHGDASPPVVIKPMSVDSFPVFLGNTGALGSLPGTLVEAIVGYYGVMQNYLATLTQYSQGYEMVLHGETSQGHALMRSLASRIKSEAKAMIQLTYTTCGLLCQFVGTDFSSPRIGVAGDSNVQDVSRSALQDAIKQSASVMGRE